jgi:Lon protease-like protein
MNLPSEIPVMVLPNAILFPQAMLPLYIFESRYRQMLSDVLDSHRMFSVALQKPGRTREAPSPVAGLGLVRASVGNRDGTSNLVLQGIARVQLAEAVRYRPYRVQKIRPLETTRRDSVIVDALAAKVLELVARRLEQGFELPVHILKQLSRKDPVTRPSDSPILSLKQVIQYLVSLENPDQLADLIACTLLPDPNQRQVILETTNLEARLKHLSRFLHAEIEQQRKKKKP